MFEQFFIQELLKGAASIVTKILGDRIIEINKEQLEKKRAQKKVNNEVTIRKMAEEIENKRKEISKSNLDQNIKKKIKQDIEILTAELERHKEDVDYEKKIIKIKKERDRKVQDVANQNEKFHGKIFNNENEKKIHLNKIKRLEKEIAEYEAILASLESDKIILSPDEIVEAELVFSENVALERLKRHLTDVSNWSNEVRFRDMHGSKTLGKIYIELDTYLMPARKHIDLLERSHKIPFEKAIFQNSAHCVIEGQPGSGKTTSAKKLCSNFFGSKNFGKYKFPVLIKFRELYFSDSDKSIISYIINLLQFDIKFSSKIDLSSNMSQIDTLLKDLSLIAFDNMFPLIIMDGFDEIPTHYEKEKALEEIRYLTRKFKNAKIIVTCRTGMFNFTLENTNAYEIAPLSNEQISKFVHNWLEDDSKAIKFMGDILESPFSDTTIKPLSLAHLCAIYQRIGRIPDKPKTVYRKLVWLLLEDWDEERSVKRASNFSEFLAERKYEYLVHLSYHLTIKGYSPVFTIDHLKEEYRTLSRKFDLPEDQCSIVTDEIESHTGLFLQTGFKQYEFVHKSIQEYLTAEYIVRLPTLKHINNKIELIGSELAIATSISHDSCGYFANIVMEVFQKITLTPSFFDAYISRLIQERPDIHPYEDLPIAILLLYDIAFGYNPKQDYDKDRIEQMHSLSRLFLKGMPVAPSINNYYDIDRKTKQYITFKVKKQHDIYRLKQLLFIPCDDYTEKLIRTY